MADNKNPNQKQPGEKEPGKYHYNPALGLSSGGAVSQRRFCQRSLQHGGSNATMNRAR
jgi:hypothetical protein